MSDIVEFKMDIGQSDIYRANVTELSIDFRYRIFLGIEIVILILLIVLFPLYKNSWFAYSSPVIIVVLLICLRIPYTVRRIKSQNLAEQLREHHNMIYLIDVEQFCARSDEMYYFVKWTLFRAIKETKKYIFLYYKPQDYWVIHKHLLPAETVDAIRNVLKQVPLEYITKE